ncbi:TBC domain-containing protein [Aphelenchoides avenae]|nr:TBC domain-containing protein [Aphelenchus avenae]
MQRNNNWTQNSALPGSVKPIYGAQYPPLASGGGSPTKRDMQFKQYENSVSDVWDAGVSLDNNLAHSSAAKVLEQHAARNVQSDTDNTIMPKCNPPPSKNVKVQAMQRLATQREPPPGAVSSSPSATSTGTGPLYPRLPEVGLAVNTSTSGTSIASNVRLIPHSPRGKNSDVSRFERLRRMLGGKLPDEAVTIDLDELRKDCWLGVPHKLRPLAWRILSGYVPANAERREVALKRKREEYWHYVEAYFHTRYDEQHQDTFRQIHIDIPRMGPLIPLFQQKMVQEIFERILYIWAIRHPASGYVQGINDLVTPFFVVFLSEFIHDDVEVGTFDVAQLKREQIEVVEADSFWCFSALLDTIQDNYTFAQPGIQRKVNELKNLMSTVDRTFYLHLENNQVEFLQFAFRWMNNLLMREIPLRATIRLWDTYLSERNGFSQFHTYVCAAFLRLWSRQLQSEKDFQGIMLLLQNLPTQNWNDQQICELTADAYSLMQVFHGAKNHLQAA